MSRDEIEKFIEQYDKLDLLKRLSALHFIPQNSHHSPATFYYLNQIILNREFDSKKEIPVKKFKELLIDYAKPSFGHLDDPFEQAFTEEVSFFDGPHIVFPGYLKGSKYIIENLLNAIFKSEQFENTSFQQDVLKHVRIVFSLSDELAYRFNLKRNLPVKEITEIIIPQNLNTIKEYVCFSEEDLLKLFQGQQNLLSLFQANYTFSHSDFEFSDDPENDIQTIKPFFSFDGLYIITESGNLINSLRYRILQLAAHHEVLKNLTSLFHNSIWRNVKQNLRFLDAKKLTPNLPSTKNNLSFHEGVWGFDIDKAIYLATIEDHLEDFEDKETFGAWDSQQLLETISKRAEEVAEILSTNYDAVNDVFIVLVISSLGRNSILLIPNIHSDYSNTSLSLNSYELKILAHIEAGKELALYKYSLAKDELSKTTEVISFSLLDKYNAFRSNGYTFYLSDRARPNLLHIGIGDGRYLINEYLDNLDRHLIHHYDGKHLTEVIRLNGDARIPIYMDPLYIQFSGNRALAVEGFRFPIWIIENKKSNSELLRGRLFAEFIEMTSFWIWQLTPVLKKFLDLLFINHNSLSILIDFKNYDSWNSMIVEEDANDNCVAEHKIHLREQKIFINIHDAFQPKSNRPDNLAEREYVSILIDAFSDYLSESGFRKESKSLQDKKENIIEGYAPLGSKKKIISFDSLENFVVDSTNLPPVRYVKKYDENIQLDNLGLYLINELNFEEGEYFGDEAVKILNESVSYFYNELCNRLSKLSGIKTLKHFISHYESIIQKKELRKITIPTQLACYSTESELTEQVSKETQDINKASISCRFIIEYIASQNPQNDQPLSKQLFDELMAIASELINWAFLSDIIHYQIVDMKVSILPSLRLGVDRSIIEQANEAFFPLQSKEHIEKAKEKFTKHWEEDNNSTKHSSYKPSFVEEIDEAHLDEFGISVTDLSIIYGDLIDLGFKISNQPYKKIEKEKLIDELLKSGDYSKKNLITGLDFLSLKQRKNFLNPPNPFTKEDVYPWRYMRPLSYLRKPLIEIKNNENETTVLWGNRHLKSSFDYLQEIVLSGRIHGKIQSEKFQQIMGKIHHDVGKSFNNLVHEKISSISDSLIVEKELRKIGSTRIGHPGNDLGDIDVLVIEPRKKNVLVLECKDLAIARNPHEMANEIESLFKGKGDNKSTVEKHLNRVNWLRKNRDLLFEAYNLKPRGNWQFYTYLIVDEEMFTPHLESSKIEVITLSRFLKVINNYI